LATPEKSKRTIPTLWKEYKKRGIISGTKELGAGVYEQIIKPVGLGVYKLTSFTATPTSKPQNLMEVISPVIRSSRLFKENIRTDKNVQMLAGLGAITAVSLISPTIGGLIYKGVVTGSVYKTIQQPTLRNVRYNNFSISTKNS